MSDEVNSPAHYTSGSIECIQAQEAASKGPEFFAEHCRLTALKYVWRLWYKDTPEQNAGKAIWYLNRAVEAMSRVGKTPTSPKEENSAEPQGGFTNSGEPPEHLKRALECAACGSWSVCPPSCPTPRNDRCWGRSHTTSEEEQECPNK